MSLTIKLRRNGKWVAVDMPAPEKVTVNELKTWIGKPCVLQFQDVNKSIYAYGNDEARGKWEEGKIVMGMDTFCDYWTYKLLELCLDTFQRQELRKERIAIMEAEKEPPEVIAKVLASRPDLYQAEIDYDIPEDF